jgi:ABC-type bacteriocin/lantibiotic exporter with double-glycine peptidase domain
MDDSIKNNIAFGLNNSEIDDLHLKNAINISQLDDLVNELPLGIEAKIGERGIKLSGGQRQRIGIARAIYKNPEILIFDESTNSLDSETEEKILNSFKKFKKDKTIIIISHNRESLKKCNKIIKIEKGTLKEVILKNK